MKKLLLLSAPLLLAGCLNFEATSSYFEPSLNSGVTNHVKVTGFMKKAHIDSIDVGARTKTTSKLVGAKGTDTAGDAEMIKALAEAMTSAFAAGAKSAAKP